MFGVEKPHFTFNNIILSYFNIEPFYFILFAGNLASATMFTIENRCSYTVWPGTLAGNGAAVLGDGGFPLPTGTSVRLAAPAGWSGRFWGRTGCNFDDAGIGKCLTGAAPAG